MFYCELIFRTLSRINSVLSLLTHLAKVAMVRELRVYIRKLEVKHRRLSMGRVDYCHIETNNSRAKGARLT